MEENIVVEHHIFFNKLKSYLNKNNFNQK